MLDPLLLQIMSSNVFPEALNEVLMEAVISSQSVA
jgi:hypothetical protein